jgi:hypothetical protein
MLNSRKIAGHKGFRAFCEVFAEDIGLVFKAVSPALSMGFLKTTLYAGIRALINAHPSPYIYRAHQYAAASHQPLHTKAGD